MSLCTGEELRPIIEAGLDARIDTPAQFIANFRDGRVVAVAAFSNWRRHDAEIALWSRGGLSRDFLEALGRYAFGTLGCARITSLVRADNPWRDQIVRLGFVLEGTLRGGADGVVDMHVFGIKAGEYRFHGK